MKTKVYKKEGVKLSRKILCTHTTKQNALQAGKEIGEKLAAINPKTVFLFASVKYDFKQLIKGILSQTKTQISGCSGAGLICGNKLIDQGAVAIGFNKENIAFGSGIGEHINKDPIKAGQDSVANSLQNLKKYNLTKIFAKYYAATINDPTQMIQKSPSFAAMTFIDGLSGQEEKVLQGITSNFPSPIPLIGGSAGDDLNLKKTLQICNNKVYENSAVTNMIMTDSLLSFAVNHGWIPRKKTVLVTKASDRIVYKLNNKPAVDVYAELLGIKKEVLLKEKQIAFKTGLKHPLAIISMAGDCWLKHPKEVFEDGSISFFSEVPEGVALVTTDADYNSLINTGINTVKKAIKPIGKDNVEAVFIFNCVARKAFLGNKAKEEIKKIAELTDAPIIGFYTYGEQAFTSNTPICHRNQVINVMVIGKK